MPPHHTRPFGSLTPLHAGSRTELARLVTPWSLGAAMIEEAWSASTLEALDGPKLRRVTLPLLAMLSLTSGETHDDLGVSGAMERKALHTDGWRRFDGSGSEVALNASVRATPYEPELYRLDSARIGVIAFRGVRLSELSSPSAADQRNLLKDLCASKLLFGWQPWWMLYKLDPVPSAALAACETTFDAAALNYSRLASERVEQIRANHSARVDRF
eukprot:3155290-Prymnesium_polylepis.1